MALSLADKPPGCKYRNMQKLGIGLWSNDQRRKNTNGKNPPRLLRPVEDVAHDGPARPMLDSVFSENPMILERVHPAVAAFKLAGAFRCHGNAGRRKIDAAVPEQRRQCRRIVQFNQFDPDAEIAPEELSPLDIEADKITCTVQTHVRKPTSKHGDSQHSPRWIASSTDSLGLLTARPSSPILVRLASGALISGRMDARE